MTVSWKRFLQNQKQRPTLELSTGTNQEPEPIKITTSEAQTVSEATNKNQPSAVIAKQREQQLMQENKPLKWRERTTWTSAYVKNLPETQINLAVSDMARDVIDEAQYRTSTLLAWKGQLSATEELEKAWKQAVSEFEQNVPSTNNLFQSVFDGRNTAENSIDKITTGLQPYEMKWLNEAWDTVYWSNWKTTISQPTIHTLDFEWQLNDAYNSVTYEFAQNWNVITVEQLQETYPFFQTLPKDVLWNFIEDCLYDVQQWVKRPLQEYADHYEWLAMIDNYTNRQDSLINVMSDPTALQYAISPYIAWLVQMEWRTKEDWGKYVESANTIKWIVTYLNNNWYNITSASDYAIAKTFENSIPELKEALRVYDEFNITENEFNQLYKHFIENVDARWKALSDPDSLQFKQIAREYAYANLKNFQQEYVNSLNKEIANPNSQYNKYFEKWRNSWLAIVDQVASLFEWNWYQIDWVFYDNNWNEIERDEVSTWIIDWIIDMIIETGKTFSDTNYDIKIFEELPEWEEKNEYQTKILADAVNSIVYWAFAYTPQWRAAQAITRIPVLWDKIIVPAIEWVMWGISEQALNVANALNFSKWWTDDTKEKYSEAMANLGTILAWKTMWRLVKTGKVRLEDFGDRTALFKNINAWSKYITKHITELDTISLSEAIKRNNLAWNELPETPWQPTARWNISTLQLLKSDIELARKYFNDTYKLALEQTNGWTFVDNLYQFIKDSTQKKVEIISPEEWRTIWGREIEAEVSSVWEEPTISEKTRNNVKEWVKVVEDLTEDLRQWAESLASKFAERRKTRAEEKQKKETEIKDKEFQKEEDLSDEEMKFLRENEYSKIITDIVDRETRVEPNKKGDVESVTTKKQRLNDSDISSDVLSEWVKWLQQYVDSLLDAQEKIWSLYDELSETQNIYFAWFFSDWLFKRILDQYKIRYDANTWEFVPTKWRLIWDKERDAWRYLKNFIEETKKIINRWYVSEYDIRKLRERSADPKDFTNTWFIAAIKKTLRSAINEYLDKTQQARVTRLIDQWYSDIKDNLWAIKDLFDKNRETKDNAAKKILQRDNDTIEAIDQNIIPGFKDLVDASRLAPKIVKKVIAKKKEIAPTKWTKFVWEIVRYVTAMTIASIWSSMGWWLLWIMMGALWLKVWEITWEWLKKKITKTKPSLKKYKEYVDRLDTTEEKKAQLKKNAEDIEKIKTEQADKFDTIYAKAMKMLLDEAKTANPTESTEITTVDDMVEIVESDPDYKPAKELAELIKETTTSLQEISVDIADKNLKWELVTEDALREQSQQDFIEFVNSLSESSEWKTTKSKRKFEEWDDDSLYWLFDTETQMPKSEVIEKLSSEELIDLINEFERRILTEQIAEATDISTINREKAAAKIERQRLKEYKEKTGEEQIQFMAEQERLRESLWEQNEWVDGSEQYTEIERTSTPEEIERWEIYLQGWNPRQIIHSTLEWRQNAKEFYEENGRTPKAKNLKEWISKTSSWEKIFEYKDGQTKLSAITAKINRVKKQWTMNSKSNKQYREKALAEKERLEKLLKWEWVEIVDEEQLIFEPKPKEVEAEEIKEAERIQEEIDTIESNETPQKEDAELNEDPFMIEFNTEKKTAEELDQNETPQIEEKTEVVSSEKVVEWEKETQNEQERSKPKTREELKQKWMTESEIEKIENLNITSILVNDYLKEWKETWPVDKAYVEETMTALNKLDNYEWESTRWGYENEIFWPNPKVWDIGENKQLRFSSDRDAYMDRPVIYKIKSKNSKDAIIESAKERDVISLPWQKFRLDKITKKWDQVIYEVSEVENVKETPNEKKWEEPLVDVAKDGTVNKEPWLWDYTTDQIQKRIDELKKKRQDNWKKLYAQELSELRVLQDLLKRQIERENREQGTEATEADLDRRENLAPGMWWIQQSWKWTSED